MATLRSKTHLFWLIPLVFIVLLAAALGGVRLLGWHWQGPGWRDGLRLERIWWRQDDCLRLEAHGVQVQGLWPVTLTLDTLTLPRCESGGQVGLALPSAPPFDVRVWALSYQNYPSVQVTAHHRAARWWAEASLQDSHLKADYRDDSGHWRLTGEIEGAHLNRRLVGTVEVQGDGVWRPEAGKPAKRFSGQLSLLGKRMGLGEAGPHGDLNARASWRGRAWTLDASLTRPLTLGNGWRLSPGRGLHAAGQGVAIDRASAELVAEGPRGRAVVSLHSDADRLGTGSGQVVFSQGLDGRIDLHWRNGVVAVQPFTLNGPGDLSVTLREAVSAPFAVEGDVQPPLTVRYRDAVVRTTDSHLHWRPNDVQWRGAVTLGGRLQGYRLGGGWHGDIGPTGAHGDPLVATLDDANLHARARIPVAGIAPPHWPVAANLDGRFRGAPFSATLSGRRDEAGWGGDLTGRSQWPRPDQGGAITLEGQWQWRDGWRLLPGARLHLARSLTGHTLIRPATFTAATPVTVNAGGVHGRFRLKAGGLVAERWVVPAVNGDLAFSGWRFNAALRVPQWGSRLAAMGRDLIGTPHGTLSGETPLKPALSQGLDVTTRSGALTLDGDWRGGATPTFNGRLRAKNVGLDWGSVTSSGLNADLTMSWRDGKTRVQSRAPVTLSKLDVGTPITDIRLTINTDLRTWTFTDIHADLLGGALIGPRLVWPSEDYQPVILTGIELSQLASLQSRQVVDLSGKVGGYIPLQLKRGTLAVKEGRLANETPLSLSIIQTSGVKSLSQSSQAVDVALGALNPLRIENLLAHIDMSADGWLDAAVTIKGFNPSRGRLPVVFHYTHRENVLDLLRSLRIGDRITNEVMKQTSNPTPSRAKAE